MKKIFCFISLLTSITSFAVQKDSTINYILPDSVKAVSFLAEITVTDITNKKYTSAGIQTDKVSLLLEKYPVGSVISFMSNNSDDKYIVTGVNVRKPNLKFPYLQFDYNWNIGESYKLLISQAADSAENFSLYSGYIFLHKENRWKLIGTVKIEGSWKTILNPTIFYGGRKKQNLSVNVSEVWCQRSNGSWKNLLDKLKPSPVINQYSNIDSFTIHTQEKNLLEKLKKLEPGVNNNPYYKMKESNGIYYSILKEGTGRNVMVTDTVTVFYKGYLLDSSVFDQTKDKPATFPLNRLIKGWQIGVPLCKINGKIRLVIPSGLAYSIRTRSAKIPPNSILIFDIEVVNAKPAR